MDCLKKALSHDKSVEFLAVEVTELLNESIKRIKAWPPAAIHLGHAYMASVLLLAITSKEESSQNSLQWKTDGPFGDLYVESSFTGEVRGIINKPQAAVNNLEENLGKGTLSVRKNFEGKNIGTGIVEANGDICLDVLEYLQSSEQRNCAMNLFVDLKWNDSADESKGEQPFYVEKAVGYLMELLPDTGGVQLAAKTFFWEERIADLKSLSNWEFSDNHSKSGKIESYKSEKIDYTSEILKKISGQDKVTEIFYQNLSFSCKCSEERAKNALLIAKSQSTDLDSKSLEVEQKITCEFCGKEYLI